MPLESLVNSERDRSESKGGSNFPVWEMFGFRAVMKRLIYLAMSGGFSHVENEILPDIMELEMIISLNEWKLVFKGKEHVLSK